MPPRPASELVDIDRLLAPNGSRRPEAPRIPGLEHLADLPEFIAQRTREGSDFVEPLAEEGTALAAPALPELDEAPSPRSTRAVWRRRTMTTPPPP